MNKNKLVAIIVVIILIGLYGFWKLNKADSQNNLSKIIPNGAYLREVKDVPNVKDIKLVVYIDQPKFEESFDLGKIMSCSGSTEGQAIEGIYHMALVKKGNLYSDVIIPSYIEEGNDSKTNQKLSYKNTRANAYYYFGGDKFNNQNRNDPVDVSLVQFGKFNTQEALVDFSITGPTGVCSHTSYLHGGYNTQSDKLIFYPIMDGSRQFYWGDNFIPSKGGEVTTGWPCGDHGTDVSELNYYTYESTASAYILSKTVTERCK